ncbi:MAG TPA: hypothetical protein VFJ91_09845, partial [Gaiellaceae bacterium]|nr:hypothetical protein [Gaiellaceae bacterium]
SAIPDAAAVAIGPLIRYAERLAPETATAGPRRLVLFPAHSFDAGTAEYEVAGLLDAVADHAASFDEVTACLYWPDVLAGRDEAYRALGVPCVTAGHRNDPAFLFRLLEILRGGAAVATNGVGTHVAYAALLGRPVWVVPQEVRYRPASERRTPADQQAALDLLNGGGGELTREVARRFAEPRDALAPEQRDFVAAVAGDESVKAPEEIAELFRRAEALFADRFGVRRRVALRLAAAARRRRSSA